MRTLAAEIRPGASHYVEGRLLTGEPRLRAAADAMIECPNTDEYYADGIAIFVAGVMADAKALARA